MRLQFVVLPLAISAALLNCSEAVTDGATKSSTWDSSPNAPLGVFLHYDGQTGDVGNRFLRVHETEKDSAGTFHDDDERGVFAMIGNAAWMKAKMKSYLALGLYPDTVMKKLKVTSTDSEGYRYYSKYFFDYYVKHLELPLSNRRAASTVDDIMNARLHHWLGNNKTPPQVFAKLKLTGTSESAVGQPNYEYFTQYARMWGREQARYRNY